MGTLDGQPERAVTTSGPWFILSSSIILTTGTCFLIWIGDQIDEFGLGNGVSLIIQINILSRLPAALSGIVTRFDTSLDAADTSKIGPSHIFILVVLLFLLMVMAVVFVTQAERRIPDADSEAFAHRFQATAFPAAEAERVGRHRDHLCELADRIAESAGGRELAVDEGSGGLFLQRGLFLYVTLENQPDRVLPAPSRISTRRCCSIRSEHAENFKQYGMFIPGIRPGNDTRDYLESVMNRITLAGAIFIAIIAMVPQIIQNTMKVDNQISDFFGGTGLLIVVGVALLDVASTASNRIG